MKIKNFIGEIIETVLLSAIVILLIYHFVASVEVVWGPSMEPNFHSGERILVDRIVSRFSKLKRGDIVVFYPPNDDSKHYIKRVVGIPGDVFKIINCTIVISRDGKHYVLSEDYLADGVCTEAGSVVKEGRSIKLTDNQYILLGDNRYQSLDSRNIGVIDKNRLVGRVVFRFWPISKIGFMK